MKSSATRRAARLFHLTLSATGSLAAATRAAGVTPAEARRLRAEPPPECLELPARGVRADVEAACTDAEAERALRLEQALAALEEEAVRRALFGVSEPVFHQGRECGTKAKHSDALLIFLLKTLRPERYGPAARRDQGDGEDSGASDGDGAPPLCVDFGGGEERTAE